MENENKSGKHKSSSFRNKLVDTLEFYDENMPLSALEGLMTDVRVEEEPGVSEEELRSEEQENTYSYELDYNYDDLMLYSANRRTRRRTSVAAKKKSDKKNIISVFFEKLNSKLADEEHDNEDLIEEIKAKPAQLSKPVQKNIAKPIKKEKIIKEKAPKEEVIKKPKYKNKELAATSNSTLPIKIIIALFLIASLSLLSVLLIKLIDSEKKLKETTSIMESYIPRKEYDKLKLENEVLIQRISELQSEVEGLKNPIEEDNTDNTEPSAQNENVLENSSNGAFITYTVNAKDTLWGISQKFLGNGSLYPEILKASGYSENTPLRPGMILTIPDKSTIQ